MGSFAALRAGFPLPTGEQAPKALEEGEKPKLTRLLQDENMAESYGLVQQFQQMVRCRQVEQLDDY
ncbi:MAG: hypothetical protein Fur005_49260 [Roseiflexaceae bacterium]